MKEIEAASQKYFKPVNLRANNPIICHTFDIIPAIRSTLNDSRLPAILRSIIRFAGLFCFLTIMFIISNFFQNFFKSTRFNLKPKLNLFSLILIVSICE